MFDLPTHYSCNLLIVIMPSLGNRPTTYFENSCVRSLLHKLKLKFEAQHLKGTEVRVRFTVPEAEKDLEMLWVGKG